MNILKALEPTGKAESIAGFYAAIDNDGYLRWFSKDRKIGEQELVNWREISEFNWLPYPNKKEIRPERAGELWILTEHDGIRSRKCLMVNSSGELKRIWDDACGGSLSSDQIHNQNGWKLIYSPDEEVMKELEGEKVVVEGVKFDDYTILQDYDRASALFKYRLHFNCNDWPEELNSDKPPMTMTLEWDKEGK
jgi:hypothetical protein